MFPDGQVLSRWWRPLAWFTVAALAIATFIWATEPGDLEPLRDVTNPVGIDLPGGVDSELGWLLLVLAVLGSSASLVVRYVRSKGLQRQQMKWLAYAGGSMFVTLAIITGASSVDSLGFLTEVLFLAATMALPVAVGIAVLRYRLYEIDRIINRTLVYAIVAGLLAALYSALVVVIPNLIPATENRDLVVAAATLMAAFLFNPLRRRVQTFVDRRFYRSRYDAQQIVEQFTAQTRNQVDVIQLTADLLQTVDRAVKPAFASMWIRSEDGKPEATIQRP